MPTDVRIKTLMRATLRLSRTAAPRAPAIGTLIAVSTAAHAAAPALNALGQTGGLVIPYGFAMPQGTMEAQYNDYLDPRFGRTATGSQMYWGAVGLLPYVEVSGGLANYPGNVHAPFTDADHFVLRHLMADVKVEMPKFFAYQPSIALGVTDVGGQTHFFRSKYGVVSQAFGPATLSVGYGSGDRLDGVFGGIEWSLWHTGISLLAEDDSKTPYAGIRYRSPAIAFLADASIVASVTRSLKSTNGVTPRTSVSVGVQIPLGHRFDASRCVGGLCADTPYSADTQSLAPAALPLDIHQADAAAVAPVINTFAYEAPQRLAERTLLADAGPGNTAAHVVSDAVATDTAAFDTILHTLVEVGLERVRVGVSGHDLVVEYENHRYNQNEADALGIVLGVAVRHAPRGIERVLAVIKKANQPLGEVSVEREAFARFLAGGAPGMAQDTLSMRASPTHDADTVTWSGEASPHGLSRIRISPVANYLYGTEYGNFDYSIAANIEGFVPLWRGAELYASFIAPLVNSKNLDDGRVYSQYRLRGGLSSAALAQSFWVAPRVLNVAAVGRFEFNYLGIENETTAFVPGRADLVRLRLAYLHHEPGHDDEPSVKNAVLTYRWVEPAWKVWVEAGVARYVGGDKGPLITLTRWFDDVSFSVHGEHSGRGSYVGAAVSFPLTLRQGMKPGVTAIEGAGQFALDFRSRVGSTNYVAPGGVQNLSFPYSSQQDLLNDGRFSAGYFASQLYRMRDAYFRYAPPPQGATGDSPVAPAVAGPDIHSSGMPATAIHE
jgi:Exopolysaccharide biosynthesis protein YbjH